MPPWCRDAYALIGRPTVLLEDFMPDIDKSIRLTIITPVFNTPVDYLSALAASVLPEMRSLAAEWLLVDDRSDDAATLSRLETLARDPGVRLLYNGGTRGAAGARNFGAARAAGQRLFFIDADDLLVPGALAALLDAMARNPRIRWLAGDFEQFSDRPPPPPSAPPEHRAVVVEHWPDAADRLVAETLFNQGSYVIDRALFLEAGGFDERFRLGEDWLLWMCLAVRGELYRCNLCVFWQRRGHASLMSGPLTATAAVVAPFLAARRDPRFAAQKRRLRWRIFGLYRLLAVRNQTLGRHLQAARFALLAALWAVNEPQQWLNVLRAALGRAPR